jgi:hypothetical protein
MRISRTATAVAATDGGTAVPMKRATAVAVAVAATAVAVLIALI